MLDTNALLAGADASRYTTVPPPTTAIVANEPKTMFGLGFWKWLSAISENEKA
jgi:hypothetical protein